MYRELLSATLVDCLAGSRVSEEKRIAATIEGCTRLVPSLEQSVE